MSVVNLTFCLLPSFMALFVKHASFCVNECEWYTNNHVQTSDERYTRIVCMYPYYTATPSSIQANDQEYEYLYAL